MVLATVAAANVVDAGSVTVPIRKYNGTVVTFFRKKFVLSKIKVGFLLLRLSV
jgi:hypothetical protein